MRTLARSSQALLCSQVQQGRTLYTRMAYFVGNDRCIYLHISCIRRHAVHREVSFWDRSQDFLKRGIFDAGKPTRFGQEEIDLKRGIFDAGKPTNFGKEEIEQSSLFG